jgi:hypothetical protein
MVLVSSTRGHADARGGTATADSVAGDGNAASSLAEQNSISMKSM